MPGPPLVTMPSATKRKKTKGRVAARDSVAKALQQKYPTWAASNVHNGDDQHDTRPCERSTEPPDTTPDSWSELLLATARPCSQADVSSLSCLLEKSALVSAQCYLAFGAVVTDVAFKQDCQVSFDQTTCCIYVRSRQSDIKHITTIFQGLVAHDNVSSQHPIQPDLRSIEVLDDDAIDDFSFW